MWGKPASRFPVLVARGVQREENGKKGEAAGAGLEAAQSLKYSVTIDGVRMEISCFQGPSAGFT